MKAILLTLLLLFPAAANADWWHPTGPLEWQWEIDHPLRIDNATDMGTGKIAWNGATAPTTDPVVYDIDGFDNPASTVAALHNLGKKVICYIEVGAAENYRPDYNQFPASTLGRTVGGYAAERYVDIRNPTVVQIVKNRIAMCAQKGFDAIEPDLDESYGARTGFPLTQADAVAYMRDLADYAHGLGLAYLAKNPDDTGDDYALKVAPFTDAVLTEQCNEYSTCAILVTAYAGKTVFNAEYNVGVANFCPKDNARAGWNGVRFPVSLKGGRKPCR